jgi:hypothetical protein
MLAQLPQVSDAQAVSLSISLLRPPTVVRSPYGRTGLAKAESVGLQILLLTVARSTQVYIELIVEALLIECYSGSISD